MSDAVNHPAHYNAHPSGVECIEIAEWLPFSVGNAIKYVWRAELKNDRAEDVAKARWYLERALRSGPETYSCPERAVQLAILVAAAEDQRAGITGRGPDGHALSPLDQAQEILNKTTLLATLVRLLVQENVEISNISMALMRFREYETKHARQS
jgi:hypothetical protein